MKKQSKHIAILSFAVLLILTLQFILTGCDISSKTMTHATEDGLMVRYYNGNRYVEDESAVFRVDDGRTKELIELGWFCELPFAMRRSYVSNTKDNPDFIYAAPFPIFLNDKIDFFKKTMICQDSEGKTIFSFNFYGVLMEKREKVSLDDDEYLGNVFSVVEDNPIICSYPQMIFNNGDYYFKFTNGTVATYKINPDYVELFKSVAKK